MDSLRSKAPSSPNLKTDGAEINGVTSNIDEEERENDYSRDPTLAVNMNVSGSQTIEIDGRVSNGQSNVTNEEDTENGDLDDVDSDTRKVAIAVSLNYVLWNAV